GVRGLYRGLPLPLFGAILENAALFMTYNQLQIGIKKITGRLGDLSMGEKAIAAAGGGTVASFILTPLELIKCKMQVQMMAAEAKRHATRSSEPLPPIDRRLLPGPLALVKEVLRTDGVRGLWLGQTGTFLREAGGAVAWFGTKEYIAKLLLRQHSKRSPDAPELTPKDLAVWESALAGAAAGIAYNIALFPADSVKSTLQTELELRGGRPGPKSTFFGTFMALWRARGLKGLYAGCGVTIARAIPIWEISPVSVSLILTTTLDTTFVKRPGNGVQERADAQDGDSLLGAEDDPEAKNGISSILSLGLAVNINGNPWNRVIMHTGEDDSEAILTIYGLMPAMRYEIDLIVASGDEAYQGVIVTAVEEEAISTAPVTAQPEQASQPTTATFQPITPESTPPSSPVQRSPTPPSTVSSGLMSVEERVAQLKLTLSTTLSERDAMSAQLRQARKESQRIENQMRSEMEALKRTGEKHAATELRSSRKILAAQKAVSQLTSASADAEKQLTELADSLLPALGERTDRVTDEHARVKDEAERSAVETEDALRADRKRAEDLDGELAELESKLEEVNKRKQEVEDGRITQLEKELEALNKELETIDKGSSVNLPIEFNHEVDYPHHYHTHPVPPPGAFHPYRNPGPRNTNNRLVPIQRPPGQGISGHYQGNNSSFSSSQRSLEGPPEAGGARGPPPNFHPANGPPAPFPLMRHPSVNAHPAPRGLFSNANNSNGAGIPRPTLLGGRRRVASNRSGGLPSSSSSLSLGIRGPNPQMDPFGPPPVGSAVPPHLIASGGIPPSSSQASLLGAAHSPNSLTSSTQVLSQTSLSGQFPVTGDAQDGRSPTRAERLKEKPSP
ncbi:hypothetical protein FRB90_005158, partial [Tulasnella sp. 427]